MRIDDLQSGQTTAATSIKREVFAANDVRILIVNNLRSLIYRCPATQQSVDLQIFADYVTLTRIRNSMRFRCPHCGSQHETRVAATHPEAIWVKPPSERRKVSAHDAGTMCEVGEQLLVQA